MATIMLLNCEEIKSKTKKARGWTINGYKQETLPGKNMQ